MFFAGGQLVVVESEEHWLVGTAEVVADDAVVRSGATGRPFVIPLYEVLGVTLAEDHDGVEEMT